MTEPWRAERVQNIYGRVVAALLPLVPQRFRRDRPVVPVVRLSGIIGFSTPLRPGLSLAGIARTLDRAFATTQCRSGRACHQFAGRLAGAIASDLPPYPRPCGRAQASRHRLRRRRRRLGRLHDRLRRRRDRRRSALGGRLDRCRRRLVRLRQADRESRHRAAALYVRRSQGHARSVPAGRSRRR